MSATATWSILGIRPEYFEDASLLSDEKARSGGRPSPPTSTSPSGSGNELYAYVPYEAPAEITQQAARPRA